MIGAQFFEGLGFKLRPSARLAIASIGMGVVFACLGLGEAVYHIVFLEFDGATDRLPLEMLAGVGLAWMAMKMGRRLHQRRLDARSRIQLIRQRNYKIRHALGAIIPVSVPGHQQAIRVIREEVDRIESALAEIP